MWGVAFGLLLISTGIAFITIGSRWLDAADTRRLALLQSAFVISPSSPQFDQFIASEGFGFAMDEPIYTAIYLWNLTNGEQVLAGTESPKVMEIGPYVYEKKTRKINVTFTQDRNQQDFGYVSYATVSSYAFDAKRSNGTEADRVVTLNATYARTLTKYRHLGYSERLLVAQYVQQHMEEYNRHLHQEFIADTKQRGLQFFLPEAIKTVTREAVVPAIQRQRERVDSSSLSRNLVRMYAVARTEAIPQVLGDVMKDITDRFLPEILQRQLEAAKRDALPRVLGNLFARLKVEAVPVMLQKQYDTQKLRQVSFTLNSLTTKLPQLAFPYVMQELFDRACLEVVPLILRTIKVEIIARDIATNRNQADVAQNNVIEAWRQQSDGARVDFDSWIDDNPTGQPRTGFELRPASDALQLSKEVATLLLGSKTSNTRFSIVDYDIQKTAMYPLDVPVDTPIGFAIWKQVIALNESSISYLIDGVNNDVAKPSDYITRDQVMFIRDYLMQWARKDVVLRDRERFWRQNFMKRTVQTDFTEPPVDLDIERTGIQLGYNLQASGASTSGVTPAIAQQLWNPNDPFSFTNVEGFTLWYQSSILQSSSASQALQTGVPGIITSQLNEISTWIKNMLADGFVLRRALRHWTDGTCFDSFKLPRSSCLIYDLEPHIPGIQSGYEMNAQGDIAIVIPQALREELWDKTKTSSFLYTVQASDTTIGFGKWMQAVRTNDTTDIVTVLSTSYSAFGTSGAAGIVRWIRQWSTNDLHVLNVQNWWRQATCWPRDVLSKSSVTSSTASSLPACTVSYQETVQSTQVIVTAAPQSPFSTTQRVLQVQEVTCALNVQMSTYTKTESSYQLTVNEYSCEAFSTELSDDHAVNDFKTGFEFAPLLKPADDRLRPSLAVISSLWNSSFSHSFLHQDGYKQWVFDYAQNTASVRTALVDAVNAQVTSACAKLNGAGIGSAIFNVTLHATDASCGAVTADQVDTLQTWVSALSKSSWMETAILDQWRRGEFASAMDIEPYRADQQSGWELSSGCACLLTTAQETKYEIPRAALSLWQADKHAASFLTSKGYALWSNVIDAIEGGDSAQITSRKQQIIAACGLSSWDAWLDRILSWLQAWTTNEHLLRDVIGHWLHGICPTPSALPVVKVVTEGPAVSNVQATCPPSNLRYQITLNDTLDDILQAASRPAFGQYFDSDVVENTARIQPTKGIQETETVITCDVAPDNKFTVTTHQTVRVKNYPSCNFLSILAQGTTASMPIVEQETHFEMNRTSENAYISMDVALAVWLNSSNTIWAFTNEDIFMAKWQRAIDRSDDLTTFQTNINAALPAPKPSDLQDVPHYLKMWQTGTDTVAEIAKAWLRDSKPFYDLDPTLEGYQGGFELCQVFGATPPPLPTLIQAKLLWDANYDYSFLNAESKVAGTFPVGFNAWREVYDGVDYSSERLVSQYPEVSWVERDSTYAHRLSESDRSALLVLMASVTGLTADQLRVIASWVMLWSENVVLRDYILETWATGLTPRGEAGAVIDLAAYIPTRFELQQLPLVAISSDELTTKVKPSILKSIPKLIRRKLWDVTTPGSLMNPASRDVWCLMNLSTSGVCPSVLDDIGNVNESSYKGFVDLVQPVVQDLETISKSSNLTALALQYFERRFGLAENQTIAIVTWWRSLPTISSFFQALQVQRWQLANDTLVKQDPMWFGFGLANVFPTNNDKLSRRATSQDLVPNPIDITPASCRISLGLVTLLWRSSNPSSFLHTTGWKMWLDYARQTEPRSTTSFLKTLADTNGIVKSVLANICPSGSASSTVEAVANWFLSWNIHPLTRQVVESLWYQPSSTDSSPIGKFTSPIPVVTAWPIDGGVSITSRTTFQRRLHARLAEIMFDPNESFALSNLTIGYPTWRTLLTDCTSTKAASFKCEPSTTANQAVRSKTASTAVQVLSIALVNRAREIDPSINATKDDVEYAIRTVVVPWLLYWLDHEVLLRFILQNAEKVDNTLQGHASTLAYTDFAAIQFTSATFSNVAYTLPDGVPTGATTYKEHLGVPSERLTNSKLLFDTENNTVSMGDVNGLAGFGEFGAFCGFNVYDRVFAYDSVTKCSVQTSYAVSIPEADAMLSTLADPTTWTSDDGSLRVKRAALIVDAFLAQPFRTLQECTSIMANLASAYNLTAVAKQNACKTTADGILLNLPLVSAMGLTSSLARIMDFQAFFKYIATKFVYEPSVLGLSGRVLRDSNLSNPAMVSATRDVYPIGGYIAEQPVAAVTSPTTTNTTLWQSSVTTPSIPSLNTYLIPTRDDPLLLSSSKERVLGEFVALNGSTKALILDTSFQLNLGHLTDGTQFMTSIVAGRHDSTFPPQTLKFYWEYAQRIVQLTFVKNITRFGIPLMRFTVNNWREPTNLPSGLDVAALADPNAPVNSVNVSRLFDDLPLVLSAGPATPSTGILEQARETAIDVDPVTGSVYHRRLSWQLTTRVSIPDSTNDLWHRQIKAGCLPVIWIREQQSVSASNAQNLMANVVKPGPFAPEKLALWGVIGGCAYVVVGVAVSIVYVKRARMMRIRRMQSVMPTGTSTNSASTKHHSSLTESSNSSKPTSNDARVNKQVDATSDIDFTAAGLVGGQTTTRARKRTTSRVPTIVEDREDTSDLQQA